ncbi:hypothetical protein [Natronorubrum sp. A-ect3]|uniref:hypothetical protein n=1 Tax=Natronorubrum sp. A-ect3 TaxID=3242698 RepID=UPI00359EFC92
MRYDVADIDEEKKAVLRDAAERFDLDIRIVRNGYSRGIVERVLALFVENNAMAVGWPLPVFNGLVVIDSAYLEWLSVSEVEHTILHEAGHHVFFRMGHEEFAEKFALKYFSGTDEEFQVNCAKKWYGWKTDWESLTDRSVGDDIV